MKKLFLLGFIFFVQQTHAWSGNMPGKEKEYNGKEMLKKHGIKSTLHIEEKAEADFMRYRQYLEDEKNKMESLMKSMYRQAEPAAVNKF